MAAHRSLSDGGDAGGNDIGSSTGVREGRGSAAQQQESLAAILMEEMASEDRWRQSFAQSQDALSKLAAEALAEDADGRTLDMLCE